MTRWAIGILVLVACFFAFGKQTAAAEDCKSGTFEGAFAGEVLLPQNWNCDERQEFWFTDQGSQIIPYVWFLNLEKADSEEKFSDPENMNRYRYLPQKPTPLNPDGLPIGFTRGNAKANRKYGEISKKWLGMTCAACHTGQVEYDGAKYLIEGAPSMADFERMFRDLVTAMEKTVEDPAKFDRFADTVIADSGTRGDGGTSNKGTLRNQLRNMTKIRKDWNERNQGTSDYGHARLDAIGAIFNEVSATALGVPGNAQDADAPVSYPFIWDTPHHDKVQWNGSVANAGPGALGRNVGEVLGVFGALDLNTNLLSRTGHSNSANVANLGRLEELVRDLWSPLWSDSKLPPIRTELRDEGREQFKKHCLSCHRNDDKFDRTDSERRVKARMFPIANPKNPEDPDALGTDPAMAENFLKRKARARDLTGRFTRYWGVLSKFEVFKRKDRDATPEAKILGYAVIGAITRAFVEDPVATVKAVRAGKSESDVRDLRRLTGEVTENADKSTLRRLLRRIVSEIQPKADPKKQACFPEGLLACYKARPLNGIWATAPYLHNGSVRTMRQLLLPSACPPDASGKPVYQAGKCRQIRFKVGSRQFEPENMGFADAGAFTLDTTKDGNSNKGHEGRLYGTEFLRDNPEKLEALLEYLKSL